jgi:hypothetical protein
MIKTLKLSQILVTPQTQIRSRIDPDTVTEYAESMRIGTKFPPVVVFGPDNILADGFHRHQAATEAGDEEIEADCRDGGYSDALRYALGANLAHGLRRTNADKRRSVELALGQWPKVSDREIARICAVCDTFVGDVRRETTAVKPRLTEKQLAESASSPTPPPETRTGADGKTRKMPAKRDEASPDAEESTVESREEEQPHAQDEAWRAAVGCTSSKNFFASQIEDIIESAEADGTMEQLQAMLLEIGVASKKVKAAIAKKRQEEIEK